MNGSAKALLAAVESAQPRLARIGEEQSAKITAADQWSAKQIIGHLIDSAANNHQRFVRAQFVNNLVFAGYEQEEWVQTQHYNEESWENLLHLWAAYNRHLAHFIEHIPESVLKASRARHTLDKIAWQPFPSSQPATLEYLVRDYVAHMQAHLEQLFNILDQQQGRH